MSETIKVGYECRKVVFYQGDLDVPREIFNKGQEALEEYVRSKSFEIDEVSEEFEIDGVGTDCIFDSPHTPSRPLQSLQ